MKIGKGVQYVQVVERSGKPKGKSKKQKSLLIEPGNRLVNIHTFTLPPLV